MWETTERWIGLYCSALLHHFMVLQFKKKQFKQLDTINSIDTKNIF